MQVTLTGEFEDDHSLMFALVKDCGLKPPKPDAAPKAEEQPEAAAPEAAAPDAAPAESKAAEQTDATPVNTPPAAGEPG